MADREALAKLLYWLNEAETGAMTWDELLAVDGEQTSMVEHYRAVADIVLERQATTYRPPHLEALVESIAYKPGWKFYLQHAIEDDGSGGLALHIISHTPNSFSFGETIRVNHAFLVPLASYNRDVWAAWLFDRVRDVETHEAGEFFRIDGVREFAPHHSNGEDPYRVWHVSDWATAAKSSGDS